MSFPEAWRKIYSTPLREPKREERTIFRSTKNFRNLSSHPPAPWKTPKQLCLRTLNLAWIRNVSFALFEEICFWNNNVINIFKLPAEHALYLTLFLVLNTHQSAGLRMATGKAVRFYDLAQRHLQWIYSVFQRGKGRELSLDLDILGKIIEQK